MILCSRGRILILGSSTSFSFSPVMSANSSQTNFNQVLIRRVGAQSMRAFVLRPHSSPLISSSSFSEMVKVTDVIIAVSTLSPPPPSTSSSLGDSSNASHRSVLVNERGKGTSLTSVCPSPLSPPLPSLLLFSSQQSHSILAQLERWILAPIALRFHLLDHARRPPPPDPNKESKASFVAQVSVDPFTQFHP